MNRLIKNQKGIALMLVLGSLIVLSTIAVEFAYNTHISYEVAAAERDRLQAYYLARSAFNLIRLELRVERQLLNTYANLLKELPGTGVSSDPLCKQLPLSTGLIKGITSGTLLGGEEKEGEGVGEEDGGEVKKEEGGETKTEERPAEREGEAAFAGDFFNFAGDFEVICDTEERKINLNVFRADPVAPSGTPAVGGAPSLYDDQKNMLFALLSQKEYEPIFEGKPDEIRKVVNAIADWADRDDLMNEAPGVSGGSEDAEYSGYPYKVKNGKYATVAEMLLVAGVGDDLYRKLAPQVTVYGDNKINLCQSSEEMMRAFVLRSSQSIPGLTPVNPEDEEKMAAVVQAVTEACSDAQPTPANVAKAIATSLGATSATGLDKLITTTKRFYRIEATGLVNESQVKVIGVLDTAPPNPNQWKTLYFRVE